MPGDVVLLRVGTSSRRTSGSPGRSDSLLDRSVLTGESVPEPAKHRADPATAALATTERGVLGHERGRRAVAKASSSRPAADRGRPDRRQPGRPRTPPVAAPARAGSARPHPAGRGDRAHRDHDRARLRPWQPARRQPAGRHLGGHRRDPRGAARPAGRDPRAGCVPAPPAGRPRASPERRGDPWRGRPGHHRQDRHADPEPAGRGVGVARSTVRSATPMPGSRLLTDALRAEDDAWDHAEGIGTELVHPRPRRAAVEAAGGDAVAGPRGVARDRARRPTAGRTRSPRPVATRARRDLAARARRRPSLDVARHADGPDRAAWHAAIEAATAGRQARARSRARRDGRAGAAMVALIGFADPLAAGDRGCMPTPRTRRASRSSS